MLASTPISSACTMSNSPRLALSSESRSKIDAILADVVEKKSMPAVFMTACSADEVLYENQGGYVDFDKPDAGRVNADTSEFHRLDDVTKTQLR